MIISAGIPLNKPNLKNFSNFLAKLPPAATESMGLVDNHQGKATVATLDHPELSLLDLTQLDPTKSVAVPKVWVATCFRDQLPELTEKHAAFIREASIECSLGGCLFKDRIKKQTPMEVLFDSADSSIFINLIAAISLGVVVPHFSEVLRHVSPSQYDKVFPFRGNATVTINAINKVILNRS